MKRLNPPLCRSTFRRDESIRPMLLLCSTALAGACLMSIGCDMGTYNQRLNEKPVVPAAETSLADEDPATDEEPSDNQ